MRNKKGFTLIELLAIIVILGLLIAIAIPSVTKYITESRRKTVITSIGSYITSVMTQVNNGEYKFSTINTIYAIPIECISLEKGGTNPFGEWLQANDAYWAYVLIQYDNENYTYRYGFTFKDSGGYGMYPTSNEEIKENGKQIKTGYDDLNKPITGLAINFVPPDKWNGFELKDDTKLIILEAESEGKIGDGKETCTLCQKGDNYEQIEENKAIPILSLKVEAKNNKIAVKVVFENYEICNRKYGEISRGIVYYSTVKLGTRVLTVNTPGRTKVNCANDVECAYNLIPAYKSTRYTFRSFIYYVDPDTNRTKYVYSDPVVTSYNDLIN